MANRLDGLLTQHLRPVTAPEDLWLRIEEPGQVCASAPPRWQMWAVAAAVAATIALFCFTLARGVEEVQFRSTDPVQIRAWVQAKAGFDIPLPAKASAGVQLIGVSVDRRSSPLVCVTYRVGNQAARLLVTRSAHAALPHASLAESYPGTSQATWAMHGDTYTLASSSAENTRRACVLCHS